MNVNDANPLVRAPIRRPTPRKRGVGVMLFAMSLPSLIGVPALSEPNQRLADLVILNSKLWTGAATPIPATPRDPSKEALTPPSPPDPTAIAVVGDTIVAVADDDAIRKRIGPDTQVIDAHGRRVIPGLCDSHTHLIGGGFQLARLNLRDVKSREEFIRAVERDVKTRKPGEWVLGGRWSVESWEKPETPQRSWIDPVTGDTPVFLSRMDGHETLVNTAALRLAAIDAAAPVDPPGGEIERDPQTREPTGILKESAMDLVSRLIPPPTFEQRYEALQRAMRHANALGVTSVHDMSEQDDLRAFFDAYGRGHLTLRITSYLQVKEWAKHFRDVQERNEQWESLFPSLAREKSELLRIAGFKGYMDGSMGSRTACMKEPFSDAAPDMPYPRGQLTSFAAASESFQAALDLADAKGWQIAIHAIGDQANHLLLDAYEALNKNNGGRDARHRIEHAQHLLVADIPRFAKLGVVASMQPYHKADDGRYAEKAIGKDRLAGSYAFRQLLDAGALLCFGSDWPVVTLNPFAGIAAAVNAKTLAGDVWLPDHSVTVEEALRAYTLSPAKAIHRESRLGTLEVSKLADIVILSDDPFAIKPDRLGEVIVDQTIVGGKVVYTKPR